MSNPLNPIHDYIAGGIGGLSGLIVGHPLDTLKVKLQIADVSSFGKVIQKSRSMLATFSMMHKEGMVKGHFRGLLSPLISYAGLNAVYFGVYGNTLSWLRNENGSTNDQQNGIKPDYFNIFIAGCVAGFVQAIPGCPFEVTKVVLQAQVGANSEMKFYKGPFKAFIDIVRRNGLSGAYRGFIIHSIRDIPSFGLYILSYVYLTHTGQQLYPSMSELLLNFMAGGVTGIISWSSIMPFDVVKNRIQADCHKELYRGIWDCTRSTYREGGITLFFKGWTAVCIRAFLVNSVTLMMYSYVLDLFKKQPLK